MKKKALALMSAVALTIMSSMTAFAASPSVDTVKQPVATQKAVTTVADTATPEMYAATTVASEGFKVVAVTTTTAEAAKVAVQNLLMNDVNALGTFLGDENIAKAATTPGSVVSASIVSTVDVNATTATKENGVYTVTLVVPGVVAGDDIVLLHYNGTAWEVIKPIAVVDGGLVFQSTSLSPVAVVKVTATGAAQAPKTGEMISIAALIALIAVAGAAFSAKKFRTAR